MLLFSKSSSQSFITTSITEKKKKTLHVLPLLEKGISPALQYCPIPAMQIFIYTLFWPLTFIKENDTKLDNNTHKQSRPKEVLCPSHNAWTLQKLLLLHSVNARLQLPRTAVAPVRDIKLANICLFPAKTCLRCSNFTFQRTYTRHKRKHILRLWETNMPFPSPTP